MLRRVFIDTGYVIALINRNDQYHDKALDLAGRYDGHPAVTTDAVLLEIGNALSRVARKEAAEIIDHFQSSDEVSIVHLNPVLFKQGLQLYRSHQDKQWGLVDCVSFVVMREMNLTEALSFDQHFAQAGFTLVEPG